MDRRADRVNADDYVQKLRRDWRDVSTGTDPAKAARLKAIEDEAAAVKLLHAALGVEEVITDTEQAHRQKRGRR